MFFLFFSFLVRKVQFPEIPEVPEVPDKKGILKPTPVSTVDDTSNIAAEVLGDNGQHAATASRRGNQPADVFDVIELEEILDAADSARQSQRRFPQLNKETARQLSSDVLDLLRSIPRSRPNRVQKKALLKGIKITGAIVLSGFGIAGLILFIHAAIHDFYKNDNEDEEDVQRYRVKMSNGTDPDAPPIIFDEEGDQLYPVYAPTDSKSSPTQPSPTVNNTSSNNETDTIIYEVRRDPEGKLYAVKVEEEDNIPLAPDIPPRNVVNSPSTPPPRKALPAPSSPGSSQPKNVLTEDKDPYGD